MVFGLPDYVFAGIILFFLGGGMGGFAVWFPSYVKWHLGSFRIAEIYDERPNGLYLLVRKKVGLGAQSFTVGKDFEFIVPNPPPILFYTNGRGVLQYVLSKARPRHVKLGERIRIHPEKAQINTPPNVGKVRKVTLSVPNPAGGTSQVSKDIVETPDTESRSVSLFIRRSFLGQTLKATGAQSIKTALPLIILVAISAFMVAYVVFMQTHPGFYPSPPPGYCYKAVPFNNATSITVSGCLHP